VTCSKNTESSLAQTTFVPSRKAESQLPLGGTRQIGTIRVECFNEAEDSCIKALYELRKGLFIDALLLISFRVIFILIIAIIWMICIGTCRKLSGHCFLLCGRLPGVAGVGEIGGVAQLVRAAES
jgi:hypothetical protein